MSSSRVAAGLGALAIVACSRSAPAPAHRVAARAAKPIDGGAPDRAVAAPIDAGSGLEARSSRSKRAALARAVGTHPLASMSGVVGANTLLYLSREHGRWSASSSMNIGGVRQGGPMPLGREDERAFDALRVVVDAALTVHVVAKGRTLLDVPFVESHMLYRFDGGIERSELSDLHPTTRFVHDRLFLALVDDVKLADVFATHSELVDSSPVGAVTLSYSPADGTFELDVMAPECCDEYDLHFAADLVEP